jgi:transcriptional regulator with PAS, ATPase and Fis domain
LLRLLQEREYFPLGSDVPRQADVRILAATNRDLLDLAKGEKFRYDLFYRLNSHRVNLPPLGERLDDLPLLVDHFLTAASQELGKRKPTPPPELITLLSTYHFPGNVRELKSMIFDAVAIHQSRMLNLDFFKNYIRNHRENIGSDSGKKILQSHFNISGWKTLPTIKQITVMLVEEALKRTNGNKSIAAQTLGITRQTLSKYMNEEIENIF